MWPPTDDNLEIYRECFANPALWKEREGNLKHSCFVVTTEDLAIHLPPGWLHATVTLRGGGTSGIEFMSADCLRISKRVWGIESSAPEKDPGDNKPLVDAILSALDHENTQGEGLAELCGLTGKLKLQGSQKKELASILRTLGTKCRHCDRIGKDHTLTFASSHRPTSKRRQARQDSAGS